MGVINPWTLAVSTPKYATAHAQGVRNHRAIKQTRAIRLQKCSGSLSCQGSQCSLTMRPNVSIRKVSRKRLPRTFPTSKRLSIRSRRHPHRSPPAARATMPRAAQCGRLQRTNRGAISPVIKNPSTGRRWFRARMKFGADSLHLKTQNTYGTDHAGGKIRIPARLVQHDAVQGMHLSSSSRRNSTTPRPMTQP